MTRHLDTRGSITELATVLQPFVSLRLANKNNQKHTERRISQQTSVFQNHFLSQLLELKMIANKDPPRPTFQSIPTNSKIRPNTWNALPKNRQMWTYTSVFSKNVLNGASFFHSDVRTPKNSSRWFYEYPFWAPKSTKSTYIVSICLKPKPKCAGIPKPHKFNLQFTSTSSIWHPLSNTAIVYCNISKNKITDHTNTSSIDSRNNHDLKH